MGVGRRLGLLEVLCRCTHCDMMRLSGLQAHPNAMEVASVTTPSDSSYREIHLSKRQVAIVDASDFVELNKQAWSASWRPKMGRFYAISSTPGDRKHKRYLHRVVMGLERGDKRMVDHINHDTLNNRRCNLRIVTNSQNMMNHGKIQRNNTSGVRWVHFEKRTQSYRVQVIKDKRSIWGGRYSSLEEAKKAAYRIAFSEHGEYVSLQ